MAQTNTVSCPHCRGPVASDPRLAGQAVKCPHCQTVFQMPALATVLVRWFVARDRQKQGPFTLPQLQQMAASGNLQPSDMLLEEGQQKWHQAREIEGIFPVAISVAVPAVLPLDAAGGLAPKESQPVRPKRRRSLLVWVLLPAVLGALVGLLAGIAYAIRSQRKWSDGGLKVVVVYGAICALFGFLLWLDVEPGHKRSGMTGCLRVAALVIVGFFGVMCFLGTIIDVVDVASPSPAVREKEEAAKRIREAREVLKQVLDGWLLHETTWEFEKKHSRIDVRVDGMGRNVLLKYEIVTGGREGGQRTIYEREYQEYEFAVLLVYQSQARTELKENEVFKVYRWKVGTIYFDWWKVSMGDWPVK